MNEDSFSYSSERFGDIQMLRYRLDGFEDLTLKQKLYIYCLAQATLWGRDITFHQFGKYNLQIRKALECIVAEKYKEDSDDFKALELYLKKVWFASGIHHHYAMDKFVPAFSRSYFAEALGSVDKEKLGLDAEESLTDYINTLSEVIFNPACMPKRVNKAEETDVIKTSANNYYEGVSQEEVERFYAEKKETAIDKRLSFGLNSTLVKRGGTLEEIVWKLNGRYGKTIEQIIHWLNKAIAYCENNDQKEIIRLLIAYYTSGNLADFDFHKPAADCSPERMIIFKRNIACSAANQNILIREVLEIFPKPVNSFYHTCSSNISSIAILTLGSAISSSLMLNAVVNGSTANPSPKGM